MTKTLFPAHLDAELRLRASKVGAQLRAANADAILVAANANIFYLSGVFFRGYVYVTADGEPYWFVIRPMTVDTTDRVKIIRKPEQIPAMLSEMGLPLPSRLALEESDLSYADIMRLSKAFEGSQTLNGSGCMTSARMVKTEREIALMRENGLHQTEAYRRIKSLYHDNMTDLEFQIEIERVLRLEGSLGFTRTAGNLMEINMGSLISGDNADAPSPYDFSMGGAGVGGALPVGANGEIMRCGTTVMVDMNGCFNGYQTDLTRVWSLGEVSDLAYKAHACAIRILRRLEEMARPGVLICDLYAEAMRIVEEENLQPYFMGHNQQVPFIGHGVGIQLNEAPAITPKNRTVIEAGMTLALEPKFVIPHVGAVGPENTYVVSEQGLLNLTPFPEEINDLTD